MTEISVIHQVDRPLTVFDPTQTRTKVAQLDAVIDYAKKVGDWPALDKAVDLKIDEIQDLLEYVDATVIGKGNPAKKGQDLICAERSKLKLSEIEQQTGISHQQFSKWRKAMATPESLEKFRQKTRLAGYKTAGLVDGSSETLAAKFTGDPEGYTPSMYIEAAREVMGSIDLDPASNEYAQRTVKATTYYTVKDDGLNQDWFGNVFLNPPYCHPEIKQFITKLLAHYSAGDVKQAILLTNNNTDTQWFHDAAAIAGGICFTKGRINFYKPDGSETQPVNGQAFFYFGENNSRFREIFSKIGLPMTRL